MTACVCGGVGFVTFVGDFRANNGTIHKSIEQVGQCPRYIDYFRSSELMRKYPGKVPVPKNTERICPAAIWAHQIAVDRELAKEKYEWKKR